VTATDRWDEARKTYTLSLSQRTPPTQGQPNKQPMVIPIKLALIGPNGSPMGWSSVSGTEMVRDMVILEKDKLEITFQGVANRPVPSLLREFSAPVKLKAPLSENDELFLARHDDDPFNRWQALQDVAMRLMVEALAGRPWSAESVGAFAKALEDTASSKSLDAAFKAHAMALPSEPEVARNVGANVDPDQVHALRDQLVRDIVGQVGGSFRRIYEAAESGEAYQPDARQSGRRALRNAMLSLMVKGGLAGADALATEQYHGAGNMTDRYAALQIAVSNWTGEAEPLLADFRSRFTADPLVLDKWLSLNAIAPESGVLARIRAILDDPAFPRTNPNRLRALVGAFANSNPTQFARPDGAGFRFVTEFCADVDKRNPQVASRVLTSFRVWQSYEPTRRSMALAALKSLEEVPGLSRNLRDILGRTLAG
jgi:aminopeptidase N